MTFDLSYLSYLEENLDYYLDNTLASYSDLDSEPSEPTESITVDVAVSPTFYLNVVMKMDLQKREFVEIDENNISNITYMISYRIMEVSTERDLTPYILLDHLFNMQEKHPQQNHNPYAVSLYNISYRKINNYLTMTKILDSFSEKITV